MIDRLNGDILELALVAAAKEQLKKKKKREKTVITGDMKPLEDSLNEIVTTQTCGVQKFLESSKQKHRWVNTVM